MTPILFDFARKSGFTLCKEESALREMLEQFAKFIIEHEAAKQHDNDPVAWATAVGSHAHISWGKNRPDYPIRYEVPLYTTPPTAPVQEPVACVTGAYAGHFTVVPTNAALVLTTGMALYTHPPQRKPLTEEEIVQISIDTPVNLHAFARAIERAHGIGGEA